MILDLTAELDRAEDTAPFTEHGEAAAWAERWCGTCRHNTSGGCALRNVALLGSTPFSWVRVNLHEPSRQYLCAEFREIEDNDSAQAQCGGRPPSSGDALHPPPGLGPAGRHRGQ